MPPRTEHEKSLSRKPTMPLKNSFLTCHTSDDEDLKRHEKLTHQTPMIEFSMLWLDRSSLVFS